jgi:hypothetical protein
LIPLVAHLSFLIAATNFLSPLNLFKFPISRFSYQVEFLKPNAITGTKSLPEYQPYLTEEMRNILIDWMTGVAVEYKLQSSTYFLAIAIVDKVLMSMAPVLKAKFQLIGCACILIAGKIEETQVN